MKIIQFIKILLFFLFTIFLSSCNGKNAKRNVTLIEGLNLNKCIFEKKDIYLKDFIPKDYDVLDSLSSDFNNDKIKDKIIVLANKNEFKNNVDRIFLVLIGNVDGKYSLIMKNPKVIPCIKCAGGAGGEESYSDLVFIKNILSFVQIKIMDTKLLEIKYQFENNNSEFVLRKINSTQSDLYENQEKKDKKIIDNLNINIKQFNYEDSQKYENSKSKINDVDGYTNLREEKNSSSKILEKVKKDSEIDVLDKTGG